MPYTEGGVSQRRVQLLGLVPMPSASLPERLLEAIRDLPADDMDLRRFDFKDIASVVGASANEVHGAVLRLRDDLELSIDSLDGSGEIGWAIVRLM